MKKANRNKRPRINKRPLILVLIGLVTILLSGFVFLSNSDKGRILENLGVSDTVNGFVLDDNTKREIELDKILSGGPGRDGIPAIDDPKFIRLADVVGTADDTLGILIKVGQEVKYYPYNILVWHEIVNDVIDGQSIAVTFCPLCGSAVVYDRTVAGQAVRFGVSGLLYESNLLMYDEATESLWSQSIGRAVVGKRTGTELVRLQSQLLEFSDVRESYPNAMVLSDDTGYSRNYSLNPYGSYDESEELLFEVSVKDSRLPSKTIMYIVPIGDKSLAFEQLKLKKGESRSASFFGSEIIARKDGSGEIFVNVDGNAQAGYFEMWFSWATQHQGSGELWKIE
jgi:hypothetical protein